MLIVFQIFFDWIFDFKTFQLLKFKLRLIIMTIDVLDT